MVRDLKRVTFLFPDTMSIVYPYYGHSSKPRGTGHFCKKDSTEAEVTASLTGLQTVDTVSASTGIKEEHSTLAGTLSGSPLGHRSY